MLGIHEESARENKKEGKIRLAVRYPQMDIVAVPLLTNLGASGKTLHLLVPLFSHLP